MQFGVFLDGGLSSFAGLSETLEFYGPGIVYSFNTPAYGGDARFLF